MGSDMLHIVVEENGSTRTMLLAGELDAFTCDRLRNVGETDVRSTRKIVLDVDGLDYIDSAGLAVLVHLWVVTRRHGVELVLSDGNRRVNRIMEITGLDRLFGSHPVFNTHLKATKSRQMPPVRASGVSDVLSAG